MAVTMWKLLFPTSAREDLASQTGGRAWGGGLLTQEACQDPPVGFQAAPLQRRPLPVPARSRQTPPVKPLVEGWLRGEDGQ